MVSANLETDAIVAATNNQHEFKFRQDDWVSKQGSATPESVSQPPTLSFKSYGRSSRLSSYKSSRSSTSSTRRFLETEAKLKRAQLESKHLKKC